MALADIIAAMMIKEKLKRGEGGREIYINFKIFLTFAVYLQPYITIIIIQNLAMVPEISTKTGKITVRDNVTVFA